MNPTPEATELPPRFLARWMGGTLAGWGLGIAAAVALAQGCDAIGLENVQCVTGIGVGAGIGVVQGRLLARPLGGGRRWTLATVIGMGAPFIAADLIRLATGASPDLLVSVVAGALLAGWLQVRVLRRHSASAGWWMAASVAGWVLAALVVLGSAVVAKLAGRGWTAFATVIAIWIASGALFALLTGAALIRILRPRS